MKRTLFLSLLLSVVGLPLHAVEWNSETTGDQIISEDVSISGTPNVGNLTFRGDSTLTGGNIGGIGNLTVESGTVVFDGVSRPMAAGTITIKSGATLKLTNGAKLVRDGDNAWTRDVKVHIYGTLKIDNIQYREGQLGCMGLNSAEFMMYGSTSAATSPRLEITESGSSSRGIKLMTAGKFYTIAVAAEKNFNWFSETSGEIVGQETLDISSAGGSKLYLEAGEDATFKLGKNIGAGLGIIKTGQGVLELNSTLNISGPGRNISVEQGTLRWGDNANIQSAGEGFFVQQKGIFDLYGKNGQEGMAVSVSGAVINGQNNEMVIKLEETGTFSISGDATSGYYGSIVLAEDAEIDLGGYAFYNTIDISAGGTLKNATNHRGTIMLGAVDGVTALDSETLAQYSSSIASTGSIEVSLSEDTECAAMDFTQLKGRFYADDSVSIAGTGEENLKINGYTTAYGAVSAQNGDIAISDINNVTLSNNAATAETTEDYQNAGALSASGSVSIEAAGNVTISGNSASEQSASAGAIYGGAGVSITGASISVTENTASDFACNGGAIRSGDMYAVSLTSTNGNVEISGNTADESGGAIYASTGEATETPGVKINSAADIVIADNTATTGDGGAIYSDGDVHLATQSGRICVAGNQAGGYGGAIYSDGTVYISGGTVEISDNHACGYGGAIYAENVVIAADAGNITFSGNTHDADNTHDDGVANDVELSGGTATLSASNGYTLEMQGGVTCAAEINISTDADSTVKLGGTSSTETLKIEKANLQGLTDADGNQAVIYVSSAVTLDNACLQDITLVDEYGEASLTSSASTYAYNDATAMLFEELDGAEVCCTSSAPLLNGFASVSGDLTIDLSYDFLQAALEASGGVADIALTLMADTLAIEEDGFTFSLSENTLAILDASVLESYGLYMYNEEGTLLDVNVNVNTLTLYDAGTVILRINDLSYVIPEPATTTLSLLALSALCLRRRRR